MIEGSFIRIGGVVQGVGFRPFVYRLATRNHLFGWVLNGEDGVEIHVEGKDCDLAAFVRALRTEAPPAAVIASLEARSDPVLGLNDFVIRESTRRDQPTVRISPDLPVCDDCLRELRDPGNRRYAYPYINCTNCGPRYTVILGLPYDRPSTTMRSWPLDDYCNSEYHDPANRRFHAQPVACPNCGPHYFLKTDTTVLQGDAAAIAGTVELLRKGQIVAIKGLGGYHLACDAHAVAAVCAMRERKFRKEKPFAVMVKDVDAARRLAECSPEEEKLLTSAARPIVLIPARALLPEVAPDNRELGIMLPYTPLQHLLFAAGAPEVLVMTSANRSSEPIAYEDQDALDRLDGIADAFLVGDRPIARRVDDSVTRIGAFGPVILRRSRGLAPGAVATLPVKRPILALGADLKNAITLVVRGEAFVSQHIGDLDHLEAFRAFEETIRDLTAMYAIRMEDLLVVHDAHPEYRSTVHALKLTAAETLAVQHHRAHIASVLAEKGAWEKRVLGVSFDGTGYGDDGAIWGGEFFAGSLASGFERVAHLRPALLPGGDAAAESPVQAAAGFLGETGGLPDFAAKPFLFPSRYDVAKQLVQRRVRTFPTTSMGRLFDTAAALMGFTREVTFEGQAAMWLEHMAREAGPSEAYPFPFHNGELDFRPLLQAVMEDRMKGRPVAEIGRSFQFGVAEGVIQAVTSLAGSYHVDTVVLSGGVFQNEMLLEDLKAPLENRGLQVWINHIVPANDGGISLGQAAMAAFRSTK